MYLLSDELKTYDHRVGICELMMLSILNHFSLFDLLVVFDWWTHINSDATLPFWVIMRSGRWNVMNHIPTKEGTIFDRRGAGNSFTMSLTATRGSSWPYMDFIFFCDVSSGGWWLCPYMTYGRGIPIYGDAATPRVFGVPKMSPFLLHRYAQSIGKVQNNNNNNKKTKQNKQTHKNTQEIHRTYIGYSKYAKRFSYNLFFSILHIKRAFVF